MFKGRRYHLIGIGGVGMSGLARLLKGLGAEVTGCDLVRSSTTEALLKEGIPVFYGHDPSHLNEVDIVVYSSAVRETHPELLKAKDAGIPVIPRAEMLSEIMALYPKSIAVAGSHGKTTTASMIAHILTKAGLEPTVAIGGKVKSLGVNARLGNGEYLVAETDESDGSFLMMKPSVGVITNVDREHLDFYANFRAIRKAFLKFARRVETGGTLVLCVDDTGARSLLKEVSGEVVTYGFSEDARVRGVVLEEGAYPAVEVFFDGRTVGRLKLCVPGDHNLQNALGALAVGLVLGLDPGETTSALSSFCGVGRRLEKKGSVHGVEVFDDYAHHPAEIRATLRALRRLFPGSRILAVFQPHRYSRTKALWREFVRELREPDVLFLTEIYAASEAPIAGISGETFFQAVKRLRGEGKPTLFSENLETVAAQVEFFMKEGDVVITMGAGDVYKVGEMILEAQRRSDAATG